MAIENVVIRTKLKIEYTDGYNEKTGEEIIKTRDYGNIKASAKNEDLYAVAHAMSSVMAAPTHGYLRCDESELLKGDE